MAYRKSLDFLPSIFQTKTNERLLRATVDQLVSEPELRQLNGFIGRKFNPALAPDDTYIQEDFADRQNYQLEPSSIYTDDEGNIKFVSGYVDLLNRITNLGGIADNPNRLFSADQYTYSGLFDFDKFINYSSYHWLPNGPDSVNVFATEIPLDQDINVTIPKIYQVVDGIFDSESFDTRGFDVSDNDISRLSDNGYTFSTTGTQINPVIRVARGGTYRFNVNQLGHGFFIQALPGNTVSYPWQQNLSIREVFGVDNNGADVGTVTFNVPRKDAQDFFLGMEIQENIDLVAHSFRRGRLLRYNEVQNVKYQDLINNHLGIDGQRFIDGKNILFLRGRSADLIPQPWAAKTSYREGDLIIHSNTVYRVMQDYTSGRLFTVSNLEVYDLEDHWYNPALFDSAEVGFDGENFDRGDTISEDQRLGWFTVNINSDGVVNLTPAGVVDVNRKVSIGEGVEFGNREVYRTANGRLELVPPITANADVLYYQDSIDPSINGIIEIVDQDNNLSIDVDSILGSKNYVSPNGVVFENGLKVRFTGTVTPESFGNKTYYVEGVGNGIDLIDVDKLETPEKWLETVSYPFDSEVFDSQSFDQAFPAPIKKQYISIKRNSIDGSAWVRQNRWFHRSVVENTSKYNGFDTILDQESRAKRPIIEFDANIQLFNYGKKYKTSVTVIDTNEKDALSNVKGIPVETVEGVVSGYYSDGIPLINGNRVVFANDESESVRQTIWRVEWITPKSASNNRTVVFIGDGTNTEFGLTFEVDAPQRLSVLIDGVSTLATGKNWSIIGNNIVFEDPPVSGSNITVNYTFGQQIHLSPVATVTEGDVILSTLGAANQGTSWYYTGSHWKKAQDKTFNNQAPLFDLYDRSGFSAADQDQYPGSNFSGNRIFSYKVGSAANDPELEIPLSFRSIGNVGDILFVDHITNDLFSYEGISEAAITQSTQSLNAIKNLSTGESVFVNQWQKIKNKSKQYQTETFFASKFQKNKFKLNIGPDSLDPGNILVFVNNNSLTQEKFDVETTKGSRFLILESDVAVGDKIDVKIFSDKFNAQTVWEIPSNLENNAKNENIKEITLGQMRSHILDSFIKTPGFQGNYQGINNAKDLPNVKANGGKILQNAGAPHLANLFLNDTKANFVESLLYAQREYATFKNKFLRLAEDLSLSLNDPVGNVDIILTEIFSNKNDMFPFFRSDMVPAGNDYNLIEYTVVNPNIDTYFLTSVFDKENASNRAVVVYLNGNQLTHGMDYVFVKDQPVIQLNIAPPNPDRNVYYLDLKDGDKISIREYSNTDGFHIPPTPTKLGLYQSFRPRIITDGYSGSTENMIQGHDGSLIVAYGDYRDDIILELEKRIYNNLKTKYDRRLFDIQKNIPGRFRESDYNKFEFDFVLSNNFSSWLGNTNLQINDFYEFDSNNPFTWNYSAFSDIVFDEPMPAGHWRGIYKHFYDTDAPHTRPWEMLGFNDQPSWWLTEYGPAPYTSGNTVLWDDLEKGRIRFGERAGIDPTYARPGLSKIIPVNSNGILLSPFECIVLNSSDRTAMPWKFGDGAPVETAWRQSSEYPFAIQLVMALTKPAEYFGLLRDTNNQIARTLDINSDNVQWEFADSGIRSKVEFVHGEIVNDQVVRSHGYLNWIAEYATSLGLDISQSVGKKLRELDLRLSYKVGGYTDKKYIKIFADQSSPDSVNSSVLIPDDDYQIKLIKSAPRLSLTYSGVIVTKSGTGFSVRGYDQTKPFFVVETGKQTGETVIIKSGSDTVEVAKEGSGRFVNIPYGTDFLDKAEVVEFLVGIGRYLERQGFRFTRKVGNSTGDMHNWKLAAKEFLFWTQQGWDNDIAITLSPIGNQLEFRSSRGAVDAISNRPYGSRILNSNFEIIDSKNYVVDRNRRDFEVQINNNQGIYLADIDVVDYEHVIVLNNTTQFNDVIYQPQLGNRQFRVKITGFKTGNWDGTFGAAGFIVNENTIQEWQPGKNYFKGEIVLYRGKYYVAIKNSGASNEFSTDTWVETEYGQIDSTLLPNLSNKAGQPKSFYDFNRSNLQFDADLLGKGLIGFTPRQYLDDLGISDTSQVKFYQGLIRQKGSNNSLDKLLRAKLDNFDGRAEFFEQWAIRNGSYGATGNIRQVRLPVIASKQTAKNPIVIEFLEANDQPAVGRQSYKANDLLSFAQPYSKNFFTYRLPEDRVNDLPSAGFVKIDSDGIDYTSPTVDQIGEFIDNNVTDGSQVWVGRDNRDSWNVYRFTDVNLQVNTVSIDGTGIATVVTDTAHQLTRDQGIYIKTADSGRLTGYYQVRNIVDSNTFKVRTAFARAEQAEVTARIYVLTELRQSDITKIPDVTPPNGWKDDDYFYLDTATQAGWGVYEKTSRYNTVNRFTDVDSQQNDNLGVSVATARNNNYLLAGSSAANKVKTYQRQLSGNLIEDVSISSPSDDLVDFGAVLAASSAGYVAVGSPSSTNNIGFVHILRRADNGSFIVDQAIAPFGLAANGEFGSAIAISDDARWLYVGQPGNDEGFLWVYQLISVDTDVTQTFIGDESTVAFTLTGQAATLATNIYSLKIAGAGGKLLVPFRDYSFDAATKVITFTDPPGVREINVLFASYYDLVLAATLGESSGDRFAASLATSTTGDQVIIGAPAADGSATTDSGKVYVVDRTVESDFADGVNRIFTTSVGIFGTPLVTVDNFLQQLGVDYQYNGVDTITFVRAPAAGSIVTIDTNNPVLTQIITSGDSTQAGAQFGFSIDLCPTNCSLYVGAPFEDNNTVDGGKVHRLIGQGRFFGSVKGTVVDPVLSEASAISLNKFIVVFDGNETLPEIVQKINDRNIPGVFALIKDNVLVINTDRDIIADKLNMYELSGNFLADTGIEIYVSQQVISSPAEKNFNNFGKVVRVSPDAFTLAVGTDVGDTVLGTVFDSDTTTFDNRNTRVIGKKQQSGAVFVYELIVKLDSTVDNPSQFIFAQKLIASDINELDRFGASVDLSNNTIYVGAPGNDHNDKLNSGLVYGFVNTTNRKVWNLVRSENPKVDIGLINNVYLYDVNSGKKIIDLDIIDPAKGRISGTAQQEINYQTTVDPAFYNSSNNTSKGIVWGKDHVGELWWNTQLTQWIEYEQDSIEYRANNWGFSFPGSRIICAEWTESNQPPENFSDPENPDAFALSLTDFNVFSEYNQNTGRFVSKYYFWVAGKTRAPKGIDNRTLSAAQIEEIISNPRFNGVPYIAFFDQNSVGLYNVEDILSESSVLVIDYDVKRNENRIHSEYLLLSEGNSKSLPSDSILTKLIDSLAGQDTAGNLVPDIMLNDFEKTGIEVRPRQSMFVDRRAAVRESVAYVNNFLKTIPAVYSKDIADLLKTEPFPEDTLFDESVENHAELGYLDIRILPDQYQVLVKRDETTRNRWVIYKKNNNSWEKVRIQSFNNSRYIQPKTWTDQEVEVPDVITTVVDFEFELQKIVATEGEFVKIQDNGLGLFKVVQRTNNAWTTVQEEKGTLQIDQSIWKTEQNLQGWDLDGFDLQLFDDWPGTEINNIFRAIYNDVFVGEHEVEKNLWFLHMIKYALSEVKYSDWAFKTSFIEINQTQRALTQIPILQKDNQDLIREYIEEIKPYHTKISEFVLRYDRSEHTNLNTTDFDLPSYFNFATGKYRSPTGATVEDEIILELEPYINWVENHKLELDGVEVYHSGSGYLSPPKILILGGGGTGAQARAVVASGRIIRVEVTDPGSGYIGTPLVIADVDTNDPAILTARMTNRQVRSIDTTIKFDRVSTTAGWLVEFKDINGNSVDVREERISRLNGSHGAIDAVLNLFSLGNWLINDPSEDIYPVANVPNYRAFDDTSGRVQFFDRRDNRGWTPELLQQFIIQLGDSVGVNAVDLRGTTVTVDGSLANFAPSLLPWTPGLTYLTDEIIVENFKLYRVTQPFVAPMQFDTAFLEDYTGVDLLSHIDRTWAFYQPQDGMPGRDLAQLFDNVVFPGVNVIGANFNQDPGFDVALFDSTGFDDSAIGPEGVPVLNPTVLDQTLRSSFLDTELGTRPEDLITAGGEFVDVYHSHAPEEMVPGQMFDTLSFLVHTLAANPQLIEEGYSPDIKSMTFKGNGVDTEFDLGDSLPGDYFLVYTRNTGPRYRLETFLSDSGSLGYYATAKQNSYTIDWQNNKIVFSGPIGKDDIVNVLNIGQVGQAILADQTFIADGITADYSVTVDRNSVGNSLVLVNGLEVFDYVINSTDHGQTQYVLLSTPPAGSRIRIVVSKSTVRNTISKINTQVELVGSADSDIPLDENLRRDRSKDTTVIVELNGQRLRSGNSLYYTGDGSTQVFELPTSGAEDYSSLSIGDIRVWKNGVRQSLRDFALSEADASSIPLLTFFEAPKVNDDISITYIRNADYFINEQSGTIQLSSRIEVPDNSLLAITSFSDHDVYKIKSKVFIGPGGFFGSTEIAPGFDTNSFDTIGFDGDQTFETFTVKYSIDDDQNSAERIFVAIDSFRLTPYIDYVVENGVIRISNRFAIVESTETIVTWFSPNIYTLATTFRIFNDMTGNVSYNRVSAEQSTTLARDLKITDTEIVVTDGSSLQEPNQELAVPGVIFVGKERIVYYKKQGNILSQLRRGTSGTAAANHHNVGSVVLDSSDRTIVPGNNNVTWYNIDELGGTPSNGRGLHLSDTIQAKFLKEFTGIVPNDGFI